MVDFDAERRRANELYSIALHRSVMGALGALATLVRDTYPKAVTMEFWGSDQGDWLDLVSVLDATDTEVVEDLGYEFDDMGLAADLDQRAESWWAAYDERVLGIRSEDGTHNGYRWLLNVEASIKGATEFFQETP